MRNVRDPPYPAEFSHVPRHHSHLSRGGADMALLRSPCSATPPKQEILIPQSYRLGL
jgi:hypothetical protein